MYLVVSVEHLGLHPAVRRAVGSLSHEALADESGEVRIVSSALLLANGPDLEPSVRASWGWRDASDAVDVGLGLELNLSHGRPLSEPDRVPGLVDGRGLFPGDSGAVLRKGLLRRLPLDQVRHEWRLQVQRVKDLGVAPTHLSTVGQVHGLPRLMALVQELAAESEIPWVGRPLEPVSSLRFDGPAWRCRLLTLLALGHTRRTGVAWPNRSWGLAEQGAAMQAWRLVKALPGLGEHGVLEVLCRPGMAHTDDQPLDPGFTGLDRHWQSELDALHTPDWGNLLASPGIKLRHFGQLRPKSAS